MKLSARFSAFFLAALAVVLIGFSLTLYFLASGYLYRQLDERLNAALDTLEGSIDVEPGGLEWEPQERRILLGTESDVESVRWAVLTLNGTVIDRSANRPAKGFAAWRPAQWPVDPPDGTALGDTPDWRMGGRRLLLEDLLQLGRGHEEDDGPENDIEYPALIILAGLSPEPIAANLRHLAFALAGISLVLWLICAALGSWLGRRALAPVSRMAAVVREMTAAQPRERIPSPGTHDELEQLSDAFNELLGRLHAAIERERRFAGYASHQLRTPIAGLLTLVDVLRRRSRTADEYAEGLGQIHDETLRMRQVVESLMFLARSDAEAMPLEFESLELGGWLRAQLERWSGHARATDIQLEVVDEPLLIKTHSALLTELLDNLLDNACKYSEPGKPIVVRAMLSSHQVRLVVQDQGSGISPEDLPHLFEPFYRSSEALRQNRRGVGLGLAIVRRIAKTLGATMEVDSKLGQGASFVLSFPEAAAAKRALGTDAITR
jgi:signal transduction histidine kinase